ncbi:porin [Paraburkholderia jirisanensis]
MPAPIHHYRVALCAAAAAAASFAGMPDAARAQSSVQLYGEIDTGLAYFSNVGGHALTQMSTGLVDGSYWGLQGSEDLGGGNKAVFRLESGFSSTSGERFNDHPHYVGLESDRYGTLTLGHQYDLIHDYFAPYTLTGGTGGTAFAHVFDNDNANNTFLASNSVKYASPSFAGLSVAALYAFSNSAGQFANNRVYNFAASYQRGPLNGGITYLHANGRGTDGGAFEPALLPGPERSVFNALAATQDTYAAGASYVIGGLTFAAAWSRSTFGGVSDADTGTAQPGIGLSNYELNSIYQLLPNLTLAGMYVYTKSSGAHWHQGALQADYTLTKRTDVYVETLYVRATPNAPAVINSVDPSSSRNQLMMSTGIRHRF